MTIAGLLFVLEFLTAQPEGKRVTFYAAQTSYSLPTLDRGGVEYAGIVESLEPLGPVSAKVDGKKCKLRFRDIEAQFEAGRTKARIHGTAVELTAPFLLESGRGYVPISSLRAVLPPFVSTTVDIHREARRVFIGVTPVRLGARKIEPGKIAFTFSAPVNPQIATEPGKLRMSFLRDPLVSETPKITFDDNTVTAASYSESNGAAEVSLSSSAPLQASFSDDRRTITVSALQPVAKPQQTTETPAAVATSSAPPQPAAAKARPRVFVLIDPAHGGDDRGASLTEKVAEKDVSLALARRLRHELEVRGVESTLLRDSDTTLNMDQRVSVANTSGAAFYLAIHATSSGNGVHLYTAMLPAQPRKPLSFVRVASAQASSIDISRALATAMSTEFLRRDMPVISIPASVPPLSLLVSPAIIAEIAPSPSHSGDELASPAYQQSTAVALANAVVAARSRIPQQEAAR